MAKILVADDNSNVQKTVALALSELGVDVVSVNNGDAAVKKLADISPDVRDEPLIKEVSGQLPGIEKLVAFPVGKSPSPDDVRKVNEAVGKIMTQIQAKDIK